VGACTLAGDNALNVRSKKRGNDKLTFTDGAILGVAVAVSPEVYLDLKREAAGAMATD